VRGHLRRCRSRTTSLSIEVAKDTVRVRIDYGRFCGKQGGMTGLERTQKSADGESAMYCGVY